MRKSSVQSGIFERPNPCPDLLISVEVRISLDDSIAQLTWFDSAQSEPGSTAPCPTQAQKGRIADG